MKTLLVEINITQIISEAAKFSNLISFRMQFVLVGYQCPINTPPLIQKFALAISI